MQGVRDELCVPVWHSDAGGIDNLIIPNHVRCGACFGFVMWHFHVHFFQIQMEWQLQQTKGQMCFFVHFVQMFFISISFRNSIFPWHPLASIVLYYTWTSYASDHETIPNSHQAVHLQRTAEFAHYARLCATTCSATTRKKHVETKHWRRWTYPLIFTSARKITGTVRQRQVHRFCWHTCWSTSHRKPGVNPEFGCRRQIT